MLAQVGPADGDKLTDHAELWHGLVHAGALSNDVAVLRQPDPDEDR
jgi:hypothetical protein